MYTCTYALVLPAAAAVFLSITRTPRHASIHCTDDDRKYAINYC